MLSVNGRWKIPGYSDIDFGGGTSVAPAVLPH